MMTGFWYSVLATMVAGGFWAWRVLRQPSAEPAGYLDHLDGAHRPPAALHGVGRTCAAGARAAENWSAPAPAAPPAGPSEDHGPAGAQPAAPARDPSLGSARRAVGADPPLGSAPTASTRSTTP